MTVQLFDLLRVNAVHFQQKVLSQDAQSGHFRGKRVIRGKPFGQLNNSCSRCEGHGGRTSTDESMIFPCRAGVSRATTTLPKRGTSCTQVVPESPVFTRW